MSEIRSESQKCPHNGSLVPAHACRKREIFAAGDCRKNNNDAFHEKNGMPLDLIRQAFGGFVRRKRETGFVEKALMPLRKAAAVSGKPGLLDCVGYKLVQLPVEDAGDDLVRLRV